MSHTRLVQTATGIREAAKQLQRRPMKRSVRTVCIITKARDNSLVLLTRELARWLMLTPRYGSDVGVTVYVDAKLKDSKRFDAKGLVAEDQRFSHLLHYWTPDTCWANPERFDLVLTLGGDGTVLFTSWLFQRIVPPVLSFSLGSLGFLTPFRFENFREDLDVIMGGVDADGHSRRDSSGSFTSSSPSISRAFPSTASMTSTGTVTPSGTHTEAGGMRVNLRMRFTCTVYRAIRGSRRNPSSNTTTPPSTRPTPSASSAHLHPTHPSNPSGATTPVPPTHYEAQRIEVLNELVIDRGPSPYVSSLSLFGDDHLLTVIQADGVIFSTPTGSTAYSLSAGGSLVHPDIPAILLTPICPHTLSFRPMLLHDTMALKVAVPHGSRAGAYCSFDGKGRLELRQGDYVGIEVSKYPFPVVERTVAREGGAAGMEWIESVSRTLRWNTREAKQKGWSTGDKPSGDAGYSGAPMGKRNSRVGEVDEWFAGPSEPSGDDGEDLEDGGEDDKQEDEKFDIDFDNPPESEGGGSRSSKENDSGFGGEASPHRQNTLL